MTSRPPSPSATSTIATVFDRKLHQRRRSRAAAGFDQYSFLKERAAEDIIDRVRDVTRSFGRALDLGAHDGRLARGLQANPSLSTRIDEIYISDLSPAYLSAQPKAVAADEELLPFKDKSFDLIVSALSLHWVNDLPGALIQIRRALAPDGLFAGALFGGATLAELRQCLLAAEDEIRGGAAQRVSPFADTFDMASLLQRAGFAMPVSDTDTVVVRYKTPLNLLYDLRGMGETSAPALRNTPPLTRSILMRAMALYQERFSDPDGRVRASFEIISASGWAPASSQPKPKRPGSASARLADALGVSEVSTGDKTGPGRR
ncbi:MAG: methyltransferase domain-containing protein [Pseudomonadota bacterium]